MCHLGGSGFEKCFMGGGGGGRGGGGGGGGTLSAYDVTGKLYP